MTGVAWLPPSPRGFADRWCSWRSRGCTTQNPTIRDGSIGEHPGAAVITQDIQGLRTPRPSPARRTRLSARASSVLGTEMPVHQCRPLLCGCRLPPGALTRSHPAFPHPPWGAATSRHSALVPRSVPSGALRRAASVAARGARHGQSAQQSADRSPRRRRGAPASYRAARRRPERQGQEPPIPPSPSAARAVQSRWQGYGACPHPSSLRVCSATTSNRMAPSPPCGLSRASLRS
jgi:hypothetical protein